MDGYGYVNDDDDGDGDDDDDNDDDEIAPDAKVSFFSVLWFPPGKMFEKWQQRAPPQMPGTMFLPHTQKTKCPVDFQQNR